MCSKQMGFSEPASCVFVCVRVKYSSGEFAQRRSRLVLQSVHISYQPTWEMASCL